MTTKSQNVLKARIVMNECASVDEEINTVVTRMKETIKATSKCRENGDYERSKRDECCENLISIEHEKKIKEYSPSAKTFVKSIIDKSKSENIISSLIKDNESMATENENNQEKLLVAKNEIARLRKLNHVLSKAAESWLMKEKSNNSEKIEMHNRLKRTRLERNRIMDDHMGLIEQHHHEISLNKKLYRIMVLGMLVMISFFVRCVLMRAS